MNKALNVGRNYFNAKHNNTILVKYVTSLENDPLF